ncbi:hypothetical protein NDA11_007953 [Ustilago hordei]|uniref:Related to TAP42-component of the Tor signaling pathway n=1 Tax=Ustilago hordei TaxID=120017 RepID=I2FQ06_USTHO|nr:uncharacterized protein UHO2_06354 [Ustilago hordei]KAJ1570330.1 hypothetical protein NDA15_001603 [Ustilago hordei]KAJ1571781.1 hypothetical protein NDA12_003030 [Ustilago hordei]KAJ1576050.1 hypothetical protein NDA11_007953 [Ustilago hordei]KAJ1604181.1 hypothetical protein NDA14_004166 [Ustilago hordei]UTT87890.1 hypothetical protein NDA17_001355 [Ustilago hordei]
MSGQTLNDLISAVFLRASDPPSPPPPQQFDPREPSASTSTMPDPASDPPAQTLSLLSRAQQISDSIGVISPNDALRDISTSSLRTLFLPSLRAELEQAVRTGADHSARMHCLHASQVAAAKFVNRVVALAVVPGSTKQLLGWLMASVTADEVSGLGLEGLVGAGATPPHIREVKIATFKLERALKTNLEQYREAYAAKKKVQGNVPSDVFYDLLLYPTQQRGDDEEEEKEEEDENVNETSSTTGPGGISSPRQYLLALLNLHVLKAAQLLASASQELQLLRNMPPPQPPSSNLTTSDASSSEWRLDQTQSRLATTGPLMAPSGKVLRPFTITCKSRAEQAAQVFRPGHRLPTMSIEEYLEEEERRGNIIQGGGQASYDAPTSTEQRQRRAEEDGTRDAQEAEEEQRQKDIHWDRFAEENKKGAGNTMNRG